jgi:hypothetical protein
LALRKTIDEMSPSEFSFKLSVPNDPEGATIVAVVAVHAVDYAGIQGAAGAAFVERVRSVAAECLQDTAAKPCQIVFAAANGQLTVTIGGQSVSQPLPA